MKEQLLFENEEVLLTSDDGIVKLTNRRIRQHVSVMGRMHFASMHLENISMITARTEYEPILFILGLLLALGGPAYSAYFNQWPPMILGLVLGGIFLLIFFLTRRHIITMISNGGEKMDFLAKGMNQNAILTFIHRVEQAKHLIK